jgi:hypothetical protein
VANTIEKISLPQNNCHNFVANLFIQIKMPQFGRASIFAEKAE